MRRAAAGVVLALMLTGCGGSGTDATYEDVNDLAAAYGDAIGAECSETTTDVEDNGWVQTTCGGTGIVMMFTSDDKREQIKENNPLDAGERYLQGAEWLITDTQFNIEEAQGVLGGEIVE
jgi:2-oxoglutarate dehydrogenase complex dehydrogenase (E1) component-like enzyme